MIAAMSPPASLVSRRTVCHGRDAASGTYFAVPTPAPAVRYRGRKAGGTQAGISQPYRRGARVSAGPFVRGRRRVGREAGAVRRDRHGVLRRTRRGGEQPLPADGPARG